MLDRREMETEIDALRDKIARADIVTKAIGVGRVFDTWEQTPCDEAPAKIWSFPEPAR